MVYNLPEKVNRLTMLSWGPPKTNEILGHILRFLILFTTYKMHQLFEWLKRTLIFALFVPQKCCEKFSNVCLFGMLWGQKYLYHWAQSFLISHYHCWLFTGSGSRWWCIKQTPDYLFLYFRPISPTVLHRTYLSSIALFHFHTVKCKIACTYGWVGKQRLFSWFV